MWWRLLGLGVIQKPAGLHVSALPCLLSSSQRKLESNRWEGRFLGWGRRTASPLQQSCTPGELTHIHTHSGSEGATLNTALKRRTVGKRKLPGQRVTQGQGDINLSYTLFFGGDFYWLGRFRLISYIKNIFCPIINIMILETKWCQSLSLISSFM